MLALLAIGITTVVKAISTNIPYLSTEESKTLEKMAIIATQNNPLEQIDKSIDLVINNKVLECKSISYNTLENVKPIQNGIKELPKESTKLKHSEDFSKSLSEEKSVQPELASLVTLEENESKIINDNSAILAKTNNDNLKPIEINKPKHVESEIQNVEIEPLNNETKNESNEQNDKVEAINMVQNETLFKQS